MMLSLAFLLIALLAFANGSNDVSKAVATLVGSGITDYRRALRWGAVWTVGGALLGGLLAGSLADRFARSLGDSAGRQPAIPLAVLVASIFWVAFSSWTGFPVSTTHAITGAILGVGWVSEGLSPLARMDILKSFFVPLLGSPLMALAATFALGPLVARAGKWLEARCVCVIPATASLEVGNSLNAVASPVLGVVTDRLTNCEGRALWSWKLSPDQAHWVSSMVVTASRGMNDAPKIWGLALPVFVLAGTHGHFAVPAAIGIVSVSMGLGSWQAGHRVTELLAHRVTRMDAREGLAANLATALLVVGASRLGLPVSTTHVSSGAILGAGLGRGHRSVNWQVFTQMAMAWVVTLPVAALLATVCFWLLSR